MALVVRSDSGLCAYDSCADDAAPLECDLKRPGTFDSYTICSQKQFSKEPVLLPKGLESVESPGFVRGQRFNRNTAPYPGKPLRQTLTAFVTANGIGHLDQRSHAHFDGSVLAVGVQAELEHHAELAADRSTPMRLKSGPHNTQRSRGVAITLLLPSATAGRPHLNQTQLALLNALARMAQAPAVAATAVSAKEANAGGSTGGGGGTPTLVRDEPIPRVWPSSASETEPRCTEAVRLSVVAGREEVASFIRRLQVRTPSNDMSWASDHAVCVSYVDVRSRQLKSVYSKVSLPGGGGASAASVSDAACAVMDAVQAVQLESGGALTVPPCFLSPDSVDLEEPEPSDHGPFLELQAELQRKFKELYLCKPFVEVSKAALASFAAAPRAGEDRRFVRVCSSARPWAEEDHTHNVGVLYASDAEILDSYLLRCRSEVPRQWPSNVWPPYVLLPPEGEELSANISVLWFKPESVHVGGDLNLFGARVRTGVPVCEFDDSHTGRVIPNIACVERIRSAGFFVVPCTRRSVLPSHSPHMHALYTAFSAFFSDTEDQLFEPMACGTSTSPDTTAMLTAGDGNGDVDGDGPLSTLFSSMMTSQLGHPCATVGDAYAVLQEHATTTSLNGSAFHRLLSAAMTRYGGGFEMETLMNLCADSLQHRPRSAPADLREASTASTAATAATVAVFDERESPFKRLRATPEPQEPPEIVSTPRVASDDVVRVDSTDRLLPHLQTEDGRRRILGLAALDAVPFPTGEFGVDFELASFDAIDALAIAWVALGLPSDSEPSEQLSEMLAKEVSEAAEAALASNVSVDWCCAAIQACLRHRVEIDPASGRPDTNGAAHRETETFFIVSNADTTTNTLYHIRYTATAATVSPCKVVDLIAAPPLRTKKGGDDRGSITAISCERNMVWIKGPHRDEDGSECVSVACYR